MRLFTTSPLPFLLLITLILFTTSSIAAKQPTSYCKCVCFQNSTIIPLNSPPNTKSSSSSHNLYPRDEEGSRDQKHRALTCNDCNRAFCLDYNLPICKDAKEEDVFATCFQRDSLKDRMIVTLFIVATGSLLTWALVKPYIVKSGVQDVVQRYAPLSRASAGDDTPLPGPNSGFGGGNFDRPARSGGGRGSISRQGGLNS